MKGKILIQRYVSPCGDLVLGAFGGELCLCNWVQGKHPGRVEHRLRTALNVDYEEGTSDLLREAVRQLDEYFCGTRRDFDLPLHFEGSDFQKTVWRRLLEIPYGSTVSYGLMARQIGRPKAVRAVANANGANAISIFVPCHRVIGSDSSLTGYGGGLDAKTFLLALERRLAQ